MQEIKDGEKTSNKGKISPMKIKPIMAKPPVPVQNATK
jgi:hypothetical protein